MGAKGHLEDHYHPWASYHAHPAELCNPTADCQMARLAGGFGASIIALLYLINGSLLAKQYGLGTDCDPQIIGYDY